ncbi:MAG TPA: YihY/virulence factor BrkB family protein [Candidatus Acidoferrales bacterium]
MISTHAPTSRHPRTSGSISSSFTRIKAKSGQTIPVLIDLIKKVSACVIADNCSDLAAQMSFYFVLSVFPFFIVLAALVGWLPSTTLWQSFAQWITGYLPAESRRAIFGIILGLSHDYTGFLSFGLLATLWTASSGFVSLMESLSVVYGQRETRSYWRRRGIGICATIIAGSFLMGAFGLLALGHKTAVSFSTWGGAAGRFRAEWLIAHWLTTFALLYLAIRCANHFLPNIRRRWRWLTPGTVFAAIALFVASHGFNIYLRYFSNVPKVYGALAGFILLMIWIYVVNLLLLVGAETDRVTERQEKAGAFA